MLSISISQPVVWSPAPAPSVAAVSAAVAVTPVQASAREGQTDTRQSDRDAWSRDQAARAQAVQADRRTEADKAATRQLEAAPLLPRPQSDEAPDQPSSEAEELQDKEEQQARQAEAAERDLQLKEVIVNVWKASGAVVERALGVDEAPKASAANDAGAADAVGSGRPVIPAGSEPDQVRSVISEDGAGAEQALLEAREVVAYDPQGHSSLAPLEAGSLVDQRV